MPSLQLPLALPVYLHRVCCPTVCSSAELTLLARQSSRSTLPRPTRPTDPSTLLQASSLPPDYSCSPCLSRLAAVQPFETPRRRSAQGPALGGQSPSFSSFIGFLLDVSYILLLTQPCPVADASIVASQSTVSAMAKTGLPNDTARRLAINRCFSLHLSLHTFNCWLLLLLDLDRIVVRAHRCSSRETRRPPLRFPSLRNHIALHLTLWKRLLCL